MDGGDPSDVSETRLTDVRHCARPLPGQGAKRRERGQLNATAENYTHVAKRLEHLTNQFISPSLQSTASGVAY